VAPKTPFSEQRWLTCQYHFEDSTKGPIEVGKLADLVILDKNPLTVDPMTISKIEVLETIMEGKTVYTRNWRPWRPSSCVCS
jgi:hypothetical protein